MLELLIIGFSSPNIPAPQAPPPPPESEASKEKRRAALEAEQGGARRRRGRRSTILTGGLGVEGPANVERKTLLGQ